MTAALLSLALLAALPPCSAANTLVSIGRSLPFSTVADAWMVRCADVAGNPTSELVRPSAVGLHAYDAVSGTETLLMSGDFRGVAFGLLDGGDELDALLLGSGATDAAISAAYNGSWSAVPLSTQSGTLIDGVIDSETREAVVALHTEGSLVRLRGASVTVDALAPTDVGRVAVADVDGDGIADYLAADYDSGGLVVRPGNASRPEYSVAVPDGVMFGVAAGDFDLDGDVDVVGTTWTGGELMLFTNTDGAGTLTSSWLFTGVGALGGVDVADLDLDGYPDIVVADVGTGPVFVQNAGDGSFAAGVLLNHHSSTTVAYDVSVCDLDGDGDLDVGILQDNTGHSVSWVELQSAPLAPSDVAVMEERRGALQLSWTPPPDNGSPITQYVAEFADGSWRALNGSVLDGLTTGVEYAVALRAKNARGTGPASAFVTGQPRAPVEIAAAPLLSLSPSSTTNAIECGDIDGDGASDFVVSGYAVSAYFSVGGYAAAVDIAALGGSPNVVGVAIADVDGDGWVDVLVQDFDSGTFLMHNNGSAALMPSLTCTQSRGVAAHADVGVVVPCDADDTLDFDSGFALNVGAAPTYAVFVDLNNDGFQDLVASMSGAHRVEAFLNLGNNTFAFSGFGEVSSAIRISVADVNGDGFADVAAATSSSGRCEVLLGDGAGGLIDEDLWVMQDLAVVRDVALVDLDLDGAIDVLASTDAGLLMAAGYGNGSFAEPEVLRASLPEGQLCVLDFDGDGDADVAHGETLSGDTWVLETLSAPAPPAGAPSVSPLDGALNVSWAAADGEGAAITQYTVFVDGAAATVVSGTNATVAGLTNGAAYAVTVAAESYRGLGRAGAATTGVPTTLVEVVNVTTVAPPTTAVLTLAQPGADLTGDGLLDPVIPDYSGNSLWLVNSTAGFEARALDVDAAAEPRNAAIADVNGDGLLDVVASARSSCEVLVFLAPDFAPLAQQLATHSCPDIVRDVTAVDVTGDGLVDVVYTLAHVKTKRVGMFNQLSDGTFNTTATLVLSASDSSTQMDQLGVCDLDGDGADELVIAPYGAGDFYVVFRLGDVVTVAQSTLYSRSVSCGDVDGDGHLDLLVSRSLASKGLVVCANADGTGRALSCEEIANSPTEGHEAALADLDRDGLLDIVVSQATDEGVQWRRNGETAFRSLFATSHALGALVAGDLDGDGDVDLAVMSTAAYHPLYLLEIETVPQVPSGVVATALPRAVNVSWDAGADAEEWIVNGTWTTAEPFLVVDGLENHVSYAFTVAARNFRGTSLPAPAVRASPTAAVEAVVTAAAGASMAGAYEMAVLGDVVAVAASSADRVVVWPGGVELSPGINGVVSVDLGDVNNDSFVDVVAVTPLTEGVYVFLGNGSGGFAEATTLLFADGVAVAPRCVITADVTGDGVVEMLAGGDTGAAGVVILDAHDELQLQQQVVATDHHTRIQNLAAVDGLLYVTDRNLHALSVWNITTATAVLVAEFAGIPNAVALQVVGADVYVASSLNDAAAQLVRITDLESSFVLARDTAAFDIVVEDLDLDGVDDVAFTTWTTGDVRWVSGAGGSHSELLVDGLEATALAPGLRFATSGGEALYTAELQSVPLAPASVNATAVGSRSVSLSWTAADDNGNAVQYYTVTPTMTTTSALSVDISGLVNGVEYDFQVFATNARGDGVPSAALAVTPTTPVEAILIAEVAEPALSQECITGDFNGDGALDIAVPDFYYDRLRIYNVTGGLLHDSYNQNYNALWGLTAYDVDGDGVQDIVGSGYASGSVSVTYGFGDSVAPLVDYAEADRPCAARYGDVDGDGADNLVFLLYGADTVAYVAANGSVVNVDTANTDGPRRLRLLDLDHDGDLDIAVAHGDGFAWFRNDGAGGFEHVADDAIDVALTDAGLELGDVDGDGDEDLLLSSRYYSAVLVDAQPIQELDAGRGAALADVDGDAALDVVGLRSSDGALVWFRGNNSGVFDTAEAELFSTLPLSLPRSIAAADLDGDGAADDLVVCHGDNFEAPVLLELQSAPFAPAAAAAEPLNHGANVSWAPAEGNGGAVTEYVVSVAGTVVATAPGSQSSVVVTGLTNGEPVAFEVTAVNFRGTSSAVDTAEVVPTHPVEVVAELALPAGDVRHPKAVELADLDQDGSLDVVLCDGTGDAVYWLRSNGTAFPDDPALVGGGAEGCPSVGTGDLNADGWVDVVAASPGSNEVVWFAGQGAGAFGDGGTLSFAADSAPVHARIADFDGDGAADILVGAHAGDWVRSVNVTSGALLQEVLSDVNAPRFFTVADLDADGAPDLVVPSKAGSALGVVLNRGVTQMFAGWNDPVDTDVGDVDGDGDLDALATLELGQGIVLLTNNGTGGFSAAAVASFEELRPNSVALFDLDLDGALDIVFTGATEDDEGEVAWMQGRGDGSFETRAVLGSGAAYAQPLGLAVDDVDGDGNADIFVAGYSGATLTQLRLQGLPFAPAVVAAEGLNQAVNVSWTAADGNGAAVTEYVVNDDWSTTATYLVVEGLANGEPQSFSVRAVSHRGASQPSEAVEATPTTRVALVAATGSAPAALDVAVVDGVVVTVADAALVLDGVEALALESGARSVAGGDLDGDGVAEYIVGHTGGALTVLSAADLSVLAAVDVGAQVDQVGVYDVNDDGFLDVLFVSSEADSLAFVANTDGAFRLADYAIDVRADIDGAARFALLPDGYCAVTAYHGDAVVVVELATGAVTATTSTYLYQPLHIEWAGEDVGLFVGLVSGAQVLLFGYEGAGVLAASDPVVSISGIDDIKAMAVADLDLDGRVDVVAAGTNYGPVAWASGGVEPQIELVAASPLSLPGDMAVVNSSALLVVSAQAEGAWWAIDTVPLPPDDVAATTLGTAATVTWTAASDTEYVVLIDETTEYALEAGDSWLTWHFEVDGSARSFRVAAASWRGVGPWSEAVEVVPIVPADVSDYYKVLASSGLVFDGAVDVSGDGTADVVVVFEDSFSVFLGDDGFATELQHAASHAPSCMTLADMTGDGLPELVVGGDDGPVQVFVGLGNGSFATPAVEPNDATWTEGARSLLAADFNNDGYEDLLVVVPGNGDIGILFSDGTTAVDPRSVDTGLTELGAAAVAYVDGDTFLDAVAVVGSVVRVYISSDGTGLTAQSTELEVGAPIVGAPAVADLNGDGAVDCAVATEDGDIVIMDHITKSSSVATKLTDCAYDGVSLWSGLTLATFCSDGYLRMREVESADWTIGPAFAGLATTEASFGDGDGDGVEDVVAVVGDFVAWYPMVAAPSAPRDVTAVFAGDGALNVSWTSPARGPVLEYALSWGDATSATWVVVDGLEHGSAYQFQVAASNAFGQGEWSVASTAVNATWGVAATGTSKFAGLSSQAFAVAVASRDFFAAVTRENAGDEAYVYQGATQTAFGSGSGGEDIALCDFDGDGGLDVFVARSTGIRWYLANASFVAELPVTGEAWGLACGDITGDGLDDLAFTTLGGELGYYNDSSHKRVLRSESEAMSFVSLADVSGDGRLDVLAAGGDWVAAYDGADGAQLGSDLAVPSAYVAVGGDLNGDGHVDAAVTSATGGVTVFWGDGSGALGASGTVVCAESHLRNPRGVTLADLNADGATDIVVSSRTDSLLVAFENYDNSGAFFEHQVLLSGAGTAVDNVYETAAVDYDDDGDLDLLVAARDFGLSLVTLDTLPAAPAGVNVSAGVVEWVDVAPPATSYEVRVDGGDGDPDELDDGVPHTVEVRGLNAFGAGAWSAAVAYDSCADGVQSGRETDVDCGFVCGSNCAAGRGCSWDVDCADDDCARETGQCATCADGVQNRDETGVDCGGAFCAPCVRCRGGDYSVYVEWDPVPGASDEYAVNGGRPAVATNATVTDGVYNDEVFAVIVEASDGRVATCEAVPVAPRTVGGAQGAVALAPALGTQGEDGATGHVGLALGDVDGDGVADLVAVDGNTGSDPALYQSNGTHYVRSVEALCDNPDWRYTQLELADYDEDGDLDVIMTGGYVQFAVCENTWPSVPFPTLVEADFGAMGNHGSGVLIDYDGDGERDLAMAIGAVNVGLYVCDVDTVTCETWADVSWGLNYGSLAACDFDGDGDDDLLVGDIGGQVRLLSNEGDPWAPDWQWQGVVLTDLGGSYASPTCDQDAGVMVGTKSHDVSDSWPLLAHPEPPTELTRFFDESLSTVTVEWSAADDNGSPVLNYTVRVNETEQSDGVIEGLQSGETVSVSVRTTTALGSSAFSEPLLITGPWVDVEAVALGGAGELTVSWAVEEDVYEFVAAITVNGVLVNGTETVVSGLPCAVTRFNVSLWTADDALLLSGAADSQTPPSGVCPRACAASRDANGYEWIDPTLAAAEEVICATGGYTSGSDDVVALSTRTMFVRYPDAAVLHVIDAALGGLDEPTSVTLTDESGEVNATAEFDPASWTLVLPATGGCFLCADQSEVTQGLGLWTAVSGLSSLHVLYGTDDPDTAVLAQPGSFVNVPWDLQEDFAFAANVPTTAHVELSVDGAEWALWADARYNATQEALHEVQARTVLDGDWLPKETSPAVVQWTYDATAPTATVATRPGEFTADVVATIGFSASESGMVFEYCVDGDACGSVSDGLTSSESPDTLLVELRPEYNVTVAADVAGASFEASVDGGDWQLMSSAAFQFAPGTLVMVRAVKSGAADPSPLVFVVAAADDTRAPQTVVVAAPAAVVTDDQTPEFAADEDGCTLWYSADVGATWSTTPVAPTDAPGSYVVLARAEDAAGNVDPTPAVVAWQVAAAPVAAFRRVPDALWPFSMSAFAVDVTGGSDCVLAWALSDGSTGEVAAESDIELGPLPFGEFTIAIAATCELPAAETLTYAWEVTAAEAAAEFSTAALAEGEHDLSVVGTDLAGNVGPERTYAWTVDTTPPDTTVAWPAELISSGSFAFVVNGSEPECSFDVSVAGNVTSAGWAAGEVLLTGLPEGANEVTVAAVDRAGNADPTPEAGTVSVDTTPPAVTVSGATLQRSVSFSVVCADLTGCFDEATFVDGMAWPGDDVADGAHVFNATAVDGAGNVGWASADFVLDSQPPETLWTQDPPPGFVNSTTVAVPAACEDEAHECAVNVSVGGAPPLVGFSFSASGDGPLNVTAWGVDAAGNADLTPLEWAVVVDTVAPVASWTEAYHASGASVELTLACVDATACSFDVDPYVVDSNVVTVADVDGEYTVTASVQDAAGNVGQGLSAVVVLDSVAPEVSIVDAPAAYTRSRAADVAFAAVDANLGPCACELDGASVPACNTTGLEVSSAGAHAFDVTCEDVRGHRGAANATWVVDEEPPELAFESSTTLTNAASLAMVFSATDAASPLAGVSCQLNFGGVAQASDAGSCESPFEFTFPADTDGEYEVFVSATDAAGNAGNVSRAIWVDREAPTLDVSAAPPSSTTDDTADFAFRCVLASDDNCGAPEEDLECSFSYALDDGARVADEDGEFALADVAEGDHAVRLWAADAAGNEAFEDVFWTVSGAALTPQDVRGPPDVAGIEFAEFWWTAPAEARLVYSYRLDTETAWTTIGTGTYLNVTLADDEAVGTHTLSLAVEGSEDSAATYVWSIAHCADVGEVEYVGDNGALICEACPAGTSCVNGVARIKPGFWWPYGDADIRDSSVFYECRVPEACDGAVNASAGLCVLGYEGVMCDTCSEGFGRTLDLRCEPCGDTDNAAVVSIFAVAFSCALVAIGMFVVRQSLSTGQTVRAVSTLKIMANYFLMMGILKDMDLDWGSLVTKVFSYMGVASGAGAADVQLVNCVARVDTFDQYRLYFVIPAVLVLVPAAALWGYAGVRRLQHAARGETVQGSARIWGHSKAFVYRQAMLVLAYFVYPVVVTNSFRVLHCTDIAGEQRLVDDYSKLCSGSEYDTLFGVATFFATALALGVPFGIFLMMRRRQEELAESGKAQTQFYFFFGEFKPEWYWWEMTVMARKVAMGAIAVLLNNHAQNMQVYVGTWLLLFSFTAQVTCLPHKDPLQRYLESASQGTVLASLLLGQGMAFQGVLGWQKDVFQYCVLGLNLLVMNCMGLVLAREVINEAKTRVARARMTMGGAALEMSSLGGLSGAADPAGGGAVPYSANPMLAAAAEAEAQAQAQRRESTFVAVGRGRGRGRARGGGRGRGRARGPGPRTPTGGRE